jgi:hypothetical protein
MKQCYAAQLRNVSGFGAFDADDAHIEYAVPDRAGRLQIPREYLERMGVSDNKIQIRFDEHGRFVLSAPESEEDGEGI